MYITVSAVEIVKVDIKNVCAESGTVAARIRACAIRGIATIVASFATVGRAFASRRRRYDR